MPVLRHLKRTPERCNCSMCAHHKQTRKTTRWMKDNPKRTTYLAEGVSTDRYNNFNHAPAKKNSKK